MTYDVVVYGGTSAGVIAAVQAKRMGRSVVIVCPDKHLGGLVQRRAGLDRHGQQGGDRRVGPRVLRTASGNTTNSRKPGSGRSRKSTATRARARRPSTATNARCGSSSRTWPSRCSRISSPSTRSPSIATSGSTASRRDQAPGRIESITMLSGKTYRGKMFIDATYEGDLMAAAGVEYHVGREAQRPTTRSGTACRRACCTTAITSAC
jgi:hypothetical protein